MFCKWAYLSWIQKVYGWIFIFNKEKGHIEYLLSKKNKIKVHKMYYIQKNDSKLKVEVKSMLSDWFLGVHSCLD